MQTDVISSAIFTATGLITACDNAASIGRTRVRAVYYSASANGTLTFREGGASGRIRLAIPITASASGLVLLPNEGILFADTPHCTVTGTLSGATVFYG